MVEDGFGEPGACSEPVMGSVCLPGLALADLVLCPDVGVLFALFLDCARLYVAPGAPEKPGKTEAKGSGCHQHAVGTVRCRGGRTFWTTVARADFSVRGACDVGMDMSWGSTPWAPRFW